MIVDTHGHVTYMLSDEEIGGTGYGFLEQFSIIEGRHNYTSVGTQFHSIEYASFN